MTIRVGNGDYVYELVENWGELPAGWELVDVVGVSVDADDNLFACTRGTHPIIKFSPAGQVLGYFGDGQFGRPHGFCVGPDGALYVADDVGQTVKKFSPEGQLLMTLGTPGKPSETGFDGKARPPQRMVKWSAGPFAWPTNVAIGPTGDLFVSDGYANARVHRFAPDGRHLQSWGDPGDGPGQFWVPHGIAVDRQGIVYVADRENSRVELFTSDGAYIGKWSPVYRPTQVYIDEQDMCFVTEFGYRAGLYPNQINPPGPPETWPRGRLTIYRRDGTIACTFGEEPVASVPTPGCFFAPHGVCTDSTGALYVCEVGRSAGKVSDWGVIKTQVLQKFVRVREAAAT